MDPETGHPGGPRDHLETERSNERSADLDRITTAEAVALMNAEDATVAAAVAAARDDIACAIDMVANRLEDGGRLFYVGAGTSGRLGVLDAVECPPTFLSDPDQVQGLIAGGHDALLRAIEGAEDARAEGGATIEDRDVDAADVVLGISAGGTTPFVHGALARARARGAATIFLACVPFEQAPDEADVSIRVVTGPEVIAGSTRLKAGTATKMVLNMISSLAMVRLGRVHGNLMVDVDTGTCAKLIERATSILVRLTGLDRDAARDLLDRAGGRVKVAVLMHERGLDRGGAEARLEANRNRLRDALEG